MERKLQERMVGAGVLILALVVVGPLLLDGGTEFAGSDVVAPGQHADELRTQTFRLDEPRPATGPPPAPVAPPLVPPAVPTAAAPAAAVSAPARPTAEPPGEPPPANAIAEPAAPAVLAPAPQAKPAAPAASLPPPAAPARPTGGFVVQVGTFGQKANAERLVKDLRAKGFDAFVSELERGGKPLFRVRVGPAGTREAAADLARRLATAGQAGQLVAT